MFMFLKRPPPGLGIEPGMRYSVTIDLELLTREPSGCFGIGGSPGESVTLKAGVMAVEPLPRLIGDYSGGRDAGAVSGIANGKPCDDVGPKRPWVYLHRVYHHPKTWSAPTRVSRV